MAAKKKRNGWGGRRPGAGRPPGTGKGPSPDARINRVIAMLSNDDLKKLQRVARKKKLPLGTLAAHIIQKSMRAATR